MVQLKSIETIKRLADDGEPLWVMLPANVFNQLPIGMVGTLMDKELIRKPLKEDRDKIFEEKS